MTGHFQLYNQVILEAFDYYADAKHEEVMNTAHTPRENIISLCKADEAVIALEEVCSYIEEYDIPIPKGLYDRLMEACLYYKIHKSYWQPIRTIDP